MAFRATSYDLVGGSGRFGMSRSFYGWCGGTREDVEALAFFDGARPEQMGALVACFRGGVTGTMWAKAAVLGVVIGLMVSVLVLVFWPDERGSTVAMLSPVFVLGFVLTIVAVVALIARRYRHEVRRHGLVLRSLVGRAEVVPWATVDPGRMFIGDSIRAATRMPLALHRQRAVFPPAVMVNGWTNRPRGSFEAFERFSGDYRYQPMPIDSPFGWWQLGVTDVRSFLTVVESAMVADGYPATGLTRFVLSRRFTARDLRRDPRVPRERALEDPVLGLSESNLR